MKTDNPLLSVNKTIEEIYSIQLHSYRCTTVVTCPQLATVTVLAIKSSLQILVLRAGSVCDRCA